MNQTKRTKEFVKNTLTAGIGLSAGAAIIGKAPNSQIKTNTLDAMNIASVGITIGGAKYAMDSLDMLTQKKKRRR